MYRITTRGPMTALQCFLHAYEVERHLGNLEPPPAQVERTAQFIHRMSHEQPDGTTLDFLRPHEQDEIDDAFAELQGRIRRGRAHYQ